MCLRDFRDTRLKWDVANTSSKLRTAGRGRRPPPQCRLAPRTRGSATLCQKARAHGALAKPMLVQPPLGNIPGAALADVVFQVRPHGRLTATPRPWYGRDGNSLERGNRAVVFHHMFSNVGSHQVRRGTSRSRGEAACRGIAGNMLTAIIGLSMAAGTILDSASACMQCWGRDRFWKLADRL